MRNRLGRPAVAMVLATVLLVAAACGSSSKTSASSTTGTGQGGTISLVAYSTPQAAYQQIEKAFQKTPAGKGVTFKDSYGASGDQSRAVVAGQKADYVSFSLLPDMTRLEKAKLVAPDWNDNKYDGFVTNSLVVFIVKKGNPKNIKDWSDLTKSGVQIVTPNPVSSGSARWNIAAAYGAQIKAGKTPAEAEQYLKDMFHNVVVQDTSARNALQTFTGGKGDVLIGYENDAIFAKQKGEPVEYVIPPQTILIQNPAAVTTKASNPTLAKAWLAFLYTPKAQGIFVKNGYRSVEDNLGLNGSFPKAPSVFRISLLGSWAAVTDKFFDDKTGIVTQIEKSMGVSTSGK